MENGEITLSFIVCDYRLHNSRVFEITPSQPVFYEFKFPENVDMVLVKANAEDDFCAMVAIQNITVSYLFVKTRYPLILIDNDQSI